MKLKRDPRDGERRPVRIHALMDSNVNGCGRTGAVDPPARKSKPPAGPTQQTKASPSALRESLRNGPGSVWRSFRRLTQLSFPKSYPIVQFPNAPLILAFVSGLVAQHSRGQEHAYAQAASYLSMVVWSYLELFHGVNKFRRLLGLAYTVSTVVHLAGALHR
jgi:hypothetical protein